MTIIEFFERELKKCKNNLEHQTKHNAPASDLENLKQKVTYYGTVCEMLNGSKMRLETKYKIGDKICISDENYTIRSIHLYESKHRHTERYFLGKGKWITIVRETKVGESDA